MSDITAEALEREREECIQACLDCHLACIETVRYCLRVTGSHAGAAHIRMLLDCAELCQTTMTFMCSGSAFSTRLCLLCADVTERCAEVCGLVGNDSTLQACADACRQCAESCRRVAGFSIAVAGTAAPPSRVDAAILAALSRRGALLLQRLNGHF